MDFEKHRVFGKENEINNCETWSLSIKTKRLTLTNRTKSHSPQFWGLLLKAHLLNRIGYHPLITLCEVTSGRPSFMTIDFSDSWECMLTTCSLWANKRTLNDALIEAVQQNLEDGYS